MGSLLEDTCLIQIGFIVEDIEKIRKESARFFDVEEPPTINSGEYKVIRTQYREESVPEAQCSMCSFYFSGLQMELTQPNEAPSAWGEQLEQHGEGLHHLAFNARGMQVSIERYEEWGMKLIQKGEYRRADGRYSFLDTSDSLKVMMELLGRDE